MIGIDTNVLIRFLVDDDPRQNRLARKLLSGRGLDDPAFVSAVTIVETVWVLNRTLGYAMPDIIAMLRTLLASDGLVLEFGRELGLLLGDETASEADLADYLIAWAGRVAGCEKTVTFDKKSATTIPSMELLA
ncbi:MAG TPA: type II toxin-antitoxin system VapC family toxin [Rhizobiaceae bacterium]|nr:type II toxin-antitoxin system VapC family toxin [Rhizobiaceae bacterium]